MPRKKTPSFEQALAELEELVQAMESGDLSLEKLMENYAKGVELSKVCMASLDRAEKAMDVVLKENDGKVEELRLEIEGDARGF
ncbi:exodeoxyribonuclease VII small subunit [uncultured Selenomonas sp.]|uniref:exodeoxyribonuclease VII small subunit n=1 Tax=uncultured Selenomonas sp. TaxID=159275 RepID=UPI0028DAF90C|nr:exodeoxyribonuclease VII small subunit [uncultured Selenomonas sp.]